jgi:hypothetical protein
MATQEYKFPDEVEETVAEDEEKSTTQEVESDEVEIEVVDDTPEGDRGRRPLNKEVEDPTEDELEEYGARSQQRIKELTHARHDERRAKESALREREEALRMAQHLIEENKRLREAYNKGSEEYGSNITKTAEMELAQARSALKAAQESYDTDAIIEAQERLAEATWNLKEAKNFKATPLQDPNYEVQTTQTQPERKQIDEKSLRWQQKNQWFGAPGYEEMTSFALGLDQKLRNQGVEPGSDTYFEQIDARIRKTFPEVFEDTREQVAQSQETPRRPTVVASAGRTSGAKKIKLTSTQLALAKKFGLTPQQYAAELAKMENQNG